MSSSYRPYQFGGASDLSFYPAVSINVLRNYLKALKVQKYHAQNAFSATFSDEIVNMSTNLSIGKHNSKLANEE